MNLLPGATAPLRTQHWVAAFGDVRAVVLVKHLAFTYHMQSPNTECIPSELFLLSCTQFNADPHTFTRSLPSQFALRPRYEVEPGILTLMSGLVSKECGTLSESSAYVVSFVRGGRATPTYVVSQKVSWQQTNETQVLP